MYTVKETPEFKAWITGLRDVPTQLRLARRLKKASTGNLGDVKSVGEGVHEMREFFGPGWRLYFTLRGDILVIMLGGGDKSSQTADIAKAQQLASTIGTE